MIVFDLKEEETRNIFRLAFPSQYRFVYNSSKFPRMTHRLVRSDHYDIIFNKIRLDKTKVLLYMKDDRTYISDYCKRLIEEKM